MEQLGNPVFVCPVCRWEHYGRFKEGTGGTTCVYCGHWQECEHLMYTGGMCVTCGKLASTEGSNGEEEAFARGDQKDICYREDICYRSDSMGETIHRVYKYRLYPTPAQQRELERQLELCRRLYNKALWWRQGAYERDGERVTRKQQPTPLWIVRIIPATLDCCKA